MRKTKGVIVYVVTMYRWGDLENHSYVHGVFTDSNEAMREGDAETDYRGGKYLPDITTHTVNHVGHKNPQSVHRRDHPEDPNFSRFKTRCYLEKGKINNRIPEWSTSLAR